MVNPAKILNFLDLAGTWDPTLIVVMAAALAVTFLGYRAAFARPAPLYARSSSSLRRRRSIPPYWGSGDFRSRLGLTGLCPGPAVAGLVYGRLQSLIFVVAMAVGILAARMTFHGLPALARARGDRS